ncbi:hypothetical protein C8J56DRAFT_1049132 [Mycena floridula]|nr:hypothetical protein C8J56DRAFT_1049132 [Mycena floridula]
MSNSHQALSEGNGTEASLGISCALPLVGSLRFKATVAVGASSDTSIKDASAFVNPCPQPADSTLGAPIGEDCLVLNVPDITADAGVPVLVWICEAPSLLGVVCSQPRIHVEKVLSADSSFNYRLSTLALQDIPSNHGFYTLIRYSLHVNFVHDLTLELHDRHQASLAVDAEQLDVIPDDFDLDKTTTMNKAAILAQ